MTKTFTVDLSPEQAARVSEVLEALLAVFGAGRAPAAPVGVDPLVAERATAVFASLLERVARLEAEVAELRGRDRRRLPAAGGGR